MTHLIIKDLKYRSWQNRAKDYKAWFAAGKMNLEVMKFLLRKYNSSHKREVLMANEMVTNFDTYKKRRINPYHLTLHKYNLMFIGLSLECYLKGYLIKLGKINPIQNNTCSLNKDIKSHNLENYFRKAFGDPKQLELEALKNLKRAIEAGKYPIEKSANEFHAFTAHHDRDIKIVKQLIRKIKKIS